MKTFKIVTTSRAYSEYFVEADSAEEAEAKFWDGESTGGETTDYADEEVVETLPQ